MSHTNLCRHGRLRRWMTWLSLAVSCLIAWLLVQQIRRTHAAEEWGRLIIREMPAGVIVCDLRGEVIQVNRAAENLSGYTEVEIKKYGLGVMIPGEMLNQHDKSMEEAAQRLLVSGEDSLPTFNALVPLRTKLGDIRKVKMSVMGRKVSGNSGVFISIFRPSTLEWPDFDVSGRKTDDKAPEVHQ